MSALTPLSAPIQPNHDSSLLGDVALIADFSTFRKSEAFFDSVFGSHCKKANVSKDGDGSTYVYICSPNSGVQRVEIDIRQSKDHTTYLMSLNLTFPYADYAKVQKLLQQRLGRPVLRTNDFASWSYKADKALNQYGNPVFNVSQDKDLKLSSFVIGLEQGDN